MNHQHLEAAPHAVRNFIRRSAELRLHDDHLLAAAQDARATAIGMPAVILSTISCMIAVAVATPPLIAFSSMAAAGFLAAGATALYGHRSRGFHTRGWHPSDFAEDLETGATTIDLEVDDIVALQHRLTENSQILEARGQASNIASAILVITPIVALVGALLTRAFA